MIVGLFDVDRTGFPNVALMKLSAWHKAQGDRVLPLNSGEAADRRYASCVFTWNRRKAEALAGMGAEIGGSGASLKTELPPAIEAMRPDYALYRCDYGLGFLMRGCPRDCGFCIVPRKEGKPREVADIDALVNPDDPRPRPFVVLLDNEFFWRVQWAIDRLHEFTARGIDFCPSQGLDARIMTPALAEALAASPFWNLKRSRRQITFAFDHISTERMYRRCVEMLFTAGIKAWQLQSFVLVGYDSTFEQDERRIAIIREYGIDPFVMVYRDPDSGKMRRDPLLQNFARWVNRHLYKDDPFDTYWPEVRRRSQRMIPLEVLDVQSL